MTLIKWLCGLLVIRTPTRIFQTQLLPRKLWLACTRHNSGKLVVLCLGMSLLLDSCVLDFVLTFKVSILVEALQYYCGV